MNNLGQKFERLWMIGDSYSHTNNHVTPDKSFYGLAAMYLGCHTIKNLSRLGNSWDSVQQLLIGNHNKIDWIKDFVFIGVPPLERITIYDGGQGSKYTSHSISTHSWQYHDEEESCHSSLVSHHGYGKDKLLVIHNNRSWTETQTLRDIFLITKWLDSMSAHYLVLNLSKSFSTAHLWTPSTVVIDYAKNHYRCLLFADTYRDINIGYHLPHDTPDPNGHHGAPGNFRFWDLSIKPMIERIYLC